jgi:hypothetical protein
MQFGYMFFIYTVPIGAALFAIAWLPTRRLAVRSRIWRFMLASVAAVGITPTLANICGSDYIVPAVWISLALRSPDPLWRSTGLAYGILPLITFAAVIFCIWSYFLERGRHDA